VEDRQKDEASIRDGGGRMSELRTFRVIRWRRVVEDARVEATSRDAAFATADDNDSWAIIDEQTVDTECEELH
jgi:hypothetical protein